LHATGNQYGFVLTQLGNGGGNGMLIGDGNDLALGINDYRQIVGATFNPNYDPNVGRIEYGGWVMIPDTGN
jgi:hypothetical protein